MANVNLQTDDIISTIDIRRNSIDNFILIWLDTNLNQFSHEFQNSLHLFQSYVNTIKLYSNSDEFQEFIQQIHDEKIFLIISDSFDEKIVSEMEINMQIYSIYVYSSQKEHHEKWTKDLGKVKGIYTNLRSIRDVLRRDVRQVNNDLIPIHILPNGKSDKLEQEFSYSLLLKEILTNSESNEQIKNTFIDFSRCHYQNNSTEENIIDEFEKSNSNQISPIQWYTRECFIYSMIYRALRLCDIKILYRIAFFISDLHRQIKDLHMKSSDHQNLTVYHAQGIPSDQFKNLNMNTNDLISFNSFLLTTIDRKVSLNFANQSRNDPNFISILFHIEIDRSKSSFPFVALDELDYYHDTDRHILFSLNSTFRIIHLERIEDRLWQINIILVDDNENTLKDLTNSLQKKYGNLKEFSMLGRMMTKTKQFDKAKHLFHVLLKNSTNHDDKQVAYIHRYLGYIYEKTNDFSNALFHYKHCLNTQLRYLPANHSSFSSIYAHIGIIQKEQGNLDEAFENFYRALKIDIHVSKPNASLISTHINNMGALYIYMADYTQALQFSQKALVILQRFSSSESKILADIHNNLSIIFYNLGQFKDANEHAAKAVNIASRIFGRNHGIVKKYQHQHNIILQKQ